MLRRDHGFAWRLAGIVALWAVSSVQAGEPSGKGQADPSPALEWMSGVPRGCRLISFDLLDGKASSLGRKDRVDVLWEYSISDHQHTSAALIQDVGVLEATASGISEGVRSVLRVTLALTPHQAHRVKLAAACSTLQVKTTTAGSSPDGETRTTWDVHGIEDRTQAIETHLVNTGARRDILQRPTLAVPLGTATAGFRGTIAVPVEVENQP